MKPLSRSRVLIVDDDAEIRDLLHILLSKHGYTVFEAESGEVMWGLLAREPVEIILLDVMLGDCDGFELCKQLREKSTIPILMISAAGEPTDRVLGLELGADDYIAKPFYAREVLARIKALLRRSQDSHAQKITSLQHAICFAGWSLYTENRRLFDPNQIEISLSVGEYVLLEALLKHPNRIVTRDQLLSYIHTHHDQEVFDRSIDVQVCRLRKRIEANPGQPAFIKTIRGAGYMLEAKVEEILVEDASHE